VRYASRVDFTVILDRKMQLGLSSSELSARSTVHRRSCSKYFQKMSSLVAGSCRVKDTFGPTSTPVSSVNTAL